MEWLPTETKLSKHEVRREMKRVAAAEHPDVLGIPLVRRVRVVRVEPPTIVVVVHVEDVQVAVGVRAICAKAIETTTS